MAANELMRRVIECSSSILRQSFGQSTRELCVTSVEYCKYGCGSIVDRQEVVTLQYVQSKVIVPKSDCGVVCP